MNAYSHEIRKTMHCRIRQEEQSISDSQIVYARERGTRYYVRDACAYFVRRRDIPADIPDKVGRQVDGLVVILSHCGDVLTTYRDRNFLRRKRRDLQ